MLRRHLVAIALLAALASFGLPLATSPTTPVIGPTVASANEYRTDTMYTFCRPGANLYLITYSGHGPAIGPTHLSIYGAVYDPTHSAEPGGGFAVTLHDETPDVVGDGLQSWVLTPTYNDIYSPTTELDAVTVVGYSNDAHSTLHPDLIGRRGTHCG